MKSKNTTTDVILGEAIRDGQPGEVEIESRDLIDVLSGRKEENDSTCNDKSILEIIWDGIRQRCRRLDWLMLRLELDGNQGLRLFLIIAVAFMMLLATVWFGVFFIKDVILHETEFNINEQGAIVPKKSLGGEYALYLFNTSEVWANPGIQINKNDRIRISISGGFNSSIEDALDAAIDNTRPLYSWVFPDSLGRKPKNGPDWALKYCLSRGSEQQSGWLSKKKYFNFGTVMYTIQAESADITDHPLKVPSEEILSWTPERRFRRTNHSGYLYFAVNDLYFDQQNLRDMEIYYRIVPSDEKEAVNNDPFFLYKDNLGQLLVAVEIKRAITPFFWRWPEVFFRGFENSFCWMKESLCLLKAQCYLSNKSSSKLLSIGRWLSNQLVGLAYAILLIIGAIFLFFVFGALNLIMLGVWTVLLCAGVCLFMQTRHRIIQKYQQCSRKQKRSKKRILRNSATQA